ncbi:AAA family ATPase [Roseovarius nitratireducens]|uniref:AAA family ATPase n=1 Tax=Roseovarius nitratireducens TaxID=2044597 RepID=UPI0013EADD50|nr:AAA family ATPase [Roseovarius nitratireducens]
MSVKKNDRDWSNTQPFALGISGKIGSGKTTLVTNLLKEYRFSVASYGAFFRNLAASRNLPYSRETFQSLTNEYLGQLNHDGLALEVLKLSDWDGRQSLLIDGIRHIESISAIWPLVRPLPFFLVFLEVPEETRLLRISKRDGLPLNAVKLHDLHESEQSVENEIRSIADVIIAENERDAAIEKLFDFVRGKLMGGEI